MNQIKNNSLFPCVTMLLFTGILLATVAQSKELQFKSGSIQTQVIELYTSEGCSSCPPADRWINGLSSDKGLWTSFIPVVFHVDYWNHLGWTDPLSSGKYADRQRQYAKSWRQKSVYTPGMVKNGLEWKAWRSAKGVPHAKESVGILAVRSEKIGFSAEFSPERSDDAAKYEVHAAILLMGFKSKVKTGENAGATLDHNFSVCSHAVSDAVAVGKKITALVAPAPCVTYESADKALVFWIAKKGSPRPLQAVGGKL